MGVSRQWGSIVRRSVFAAACILGGAPRVEATWSIVVADSRTGEVCVASATCLVHFDLKPQLALIQVGRGAAAAQSAVDTTTQYRMYIWGQLKENARPYDIIDGLKALDPGHQSKQYGIVSMDTQPATFTGSTAGLAKYGITGVIDSLTYAIQGNVLTGWSVCYLAESALLGTPGDLSQRVMAAMQAAHSVGGDGRCSCPGSHPTSCGVPPPSFTYSAYTAFIVLARMGDQDGACKPGFGCANGNYYLDINAIGGQQAPQPIGRLQERYNEWRAGLAGRADHLVSMVTPASASLAADGRASTTIDVLLLDVDGLPVTIAPDEIIVTPTGTSGPLAHLGPVDDLGGGRYSFQLGANQQSGRGTWSVGARYGTKTVRLWPDFTIDFVRP